MTGNDLARASRELQPLEQGDLDGLCGLYAIINALRILLYPDRVISTRLSGQLLDCGLRSLAQKRKLREAIVNGMDYEQWLSMCLAVVTKAERLLGVRIVLEPLVDDDRTWHTRDVIRSIRRSLHQNRPLILCFEGRLEHWSVVSGCTAARLKLFDSAGCRWICIRSLTASVLRAGKPHLVNKGAAITVVAP